MKDQKGNTLAVNDIVFHNNGGLGIIRKIGRAKVHISYIGSLSDDHNSTNTVSPSSLMIPDNKAYADMVRRTLGV